MSSAPPVFLPNPSGPTSKPTGAWIIISIIGVILMCLIGIGSLAFIGLKYGHARPRKGWQEPLVGIKVKGSWSRYRISPMGLTLLAFKTPEADKDLEPLMRTRYDVHEYAGYRVGNRNLRVKICGYWFGRFAAARLAKDGLDYLARQRQLHLQKSFPSFTQSKITSTWMDGVEAREVSITFTYKGLSWTTQSEIQLRENATFYLEGTYWNGKDQWGKRAFDYIVKTIQFDAPASN